MLILTEKPSVAKDIATALGGYTPQKGYYLKGSDCIVYASGHLLELAAPDEYDTRYKTWNIADLPIIPEKMKYRPIAEHRERLAVIKKCFEQFGSGDFILATDPEREGELIGALILDYVGFTSYRTARRFWVAEALTPEIVWKGISSARPLSEYDSYRLSGCARQQADWLIGMNITRLLSVSTGGSLFSFGRVQTAVLGAVYLRDRAIAGFKPVPYNLVEAVCPGFSLYLADEKGNSRFRTGSSSVSSAVEHIHGGDTVTVTGIETLHKREQPPQLFNITGLQKYCSKRYHYSPKQTLQIVQELYEKLKCMSYPRTPSVVLGDDNVDLYRKLFEVLSEKYPEAAEGCMTEKITADNKKLFNSAKLTEHHALIPLGVLPETAAEAQRNVYSAVLERFFTVIKPDYEYDAVSVKAVCRGFPFTGTGRTVTRQGWKIQQEEDGEDIPPFPCLVSGQAYRLENLNVLEKQTKPKPHFTNAAVLALMENPKGDDGTHLAGIGTPATRADIIATLLEREYIRQEKQNLLITEKGIFLIETVIKIPSLRDFISIATTTEWEEQLEKTPDLFLRNIKTFLRTEVPEMKIEGHWEGSSLGKCPLCKSGHIVPGKKSYFCSEWKTSGCRFTIWKNICGASVTANDVQILLSGKKTREKKMKNRTGKEFSARLILGPDGTVQFAPFEK